MKNNDEKILLEKLANNYFNEKNSEDIIYGTQSNFQTYNRQYMLKKCLKYMGENGIALELGCETGYMSSLISQHVKSLTTIDGSKTFIAKAKQRNLSNVKFVYSLFEEIDEFQKYDYVFASHVLEHLFDPQNVLKRIKKALKPTGKVFVVVPNARSISRQLAHTMGIVPDIYGLTPNDLNGGHRRVYDFDSVKNEVSKSGLKIIEISGLFYKPFADFQMDELINIGMLTDKHINGLYNLGNKYPEHSGAIFLAAENN